MLRGVYVTIGGTVGGTIGGTVGGTIGDTIVNIRFLAVQVRLVKDSSEEHLFRFSIKKIIFAKEISKRRKYEKDK